MAFNLYAIVMAATRTPHPHLPIDDIVSDDGIAQETSAITTAMRADGPYPYLYRATWDTDNGLHLRRCRHELMQPGNHVRRVGVNPFGHEGVLEQLLNQRIDEVVLAVGVKPLR